MSNISSPLGTRQGAFRVSQSGQAVYDLPIIVPPGIAGMQPQLSLIYNQSSNNGICGVGWTLGGLSAITRVAGTQFIDGFRGSINYDNNDRYGLDGERLINMTGAYGQPGTVYYTQQHNWRKIIAGATPQDGFTVYTKSGEIWRYGTTPDSCIMACGLPHVRVWALDSIEDLNGNRIEYQYSAQPTGTPGAMGSAPTGEFYIARINYIVRAGTTGNFSVLFNYTGRADAKITYLGGAMVQTDYLLASITTLMGSTPVKSYALNYGTGVATGLSRLESVMVTGADGTSLAPWEFSWQDVSSLAFNTNSNASQLLNTSGLLQTVPADANGDGVTDILQFYTDPTSGNIGVVSFLAQNANGSVTYAATNPNGSLLGYYQQPYQIISADVNGDGMADVVVVYPNNNLLSIDVYINTGNAFNAPLTTNTTDQWQGSSSIGFYAVDADGDGRIDLVQAYRDSNDMLYFNTYLSQFAGAAGQFSSTYYYQSTQPYTGLQQIWPMDVNGDGMTDMVVMCDNNGQVQVTSFVTRQPSTTGFFAAMVDTTLNTITNYQLSILPADVNGDGMVDLLQVNEYNGDFVLQSFFSDGMGGFITGPSTTFANQQFSSSQLTPMAFTGAAQTNIVAGWLDQNDNWNYTIFSSDPSGRFTQSPSVQSNVQIPELSFLGGGDATGNGKADVLNYYNDGSGNYWVQPFLSTGPFPDLVTEITDAFGKTITVAYAPLTNSTVYAHQPLVFPQTTACRLPSLLTPAQFPVQQIMGSAMYVVAGYKLSNNTGINRFSVAQQYTMQYTGARINNMAMGWEGFLTVSKTNMGTGLSSVKTYLQEMPYTGLVASVAKEAVPSISTDPKVKGATGNVLLSLIVYSYTGVPYPTPGSNSSAAYQVNKTATLAYGYNYGQANWEQLLATTYAFDAYGNRTLRTWLGYTQFVDPFFPGINTQLPALAPLNQAEVTYTYSQYQNTISANGAWILGYLTFKKVSGNSAAGPVNTFVTGDFSLLAKTYNANNSVASISVWDDQFQRMRTSTLTYDQFGNATSQTLPDQTTIDFTIEQQYNTYLASASMQIAATGITIQVLAGFDPRFGVRIAGQDPNGLIDIITLDGFGRPILKQGPVPDGCNQSDANGCSPLVTGTGAFTTATVLTLTQITYGNDGAGGLYRQVEELQEFPASTARVFTQQQYYTDALSRNVQLVDNLLNSQGYAVTLKTFGTNGKMLTESIPFFASTPINAQPAELISYTYDVLGRVLLVVHPSGPNGTQANTHTLAYDSCSKITTCQGANTPEQYIEQITNHVFNGHLKEIELLVPADNNATTQFVCDALGRLVQATDPQGIVNTLSYDAMNRVLTRNNPDQNTTGVAGSDALTYQYNSSTAELLSVTDVSGAHTVYDFDPLKRALSQTYSDGRKKTYLYDTGKYGIGRLTSSIVYDAAGQIESEYSYGYDKYGNKISETISIGSTAYTTTNLYDPQHRLIAQTYPDGSVLTNTYSNGVLTEQQLDGVSLQYPINGYNAAGRYTQVQYANGGSTVLQTQFTYNGMQQLYGELWNNEAGQSLLNYSFNYDALFQITTNNEQISSRQETYTYQNKRLIGASNNIPSVAPESYDFDNAGRITQKNGNNYSYSNSHFPSGITGNIGYSAVQDVTGKVISRTAGGNTQQYTYDVPGNLLSIKSGGTEIRRMQYDLMNRRLTETLSNGSVRSFINAAYRILQDAAGNITITKYISNDNGLTASIETGVGTTNVLFFRHDNKGNVTHVYNSAGTLVTAYAYQGFGMPITISGGTGTGQEPRYEGNIYDAETGLFYFGARYYDPLTCLFLTPDNQLGGPGKRVPGAWNRFSFELNNPVNHVDANGHMSLWAKIGIGIGLGLLTIVGIAATIFTGGASDVAVAAVDASFAAGEVAADAAGEGAAEAVADAAGSAGESAGDVVGESTGESAGESAGDSAGDTAGATRSIGSRIAQTVARNAVRAGVKAMGGTISSVCTGTGTNGITYLIQSGNNASFSDLDEGLKQAAISGAISGSISGAVSGSLDDLAEMVPHTAMGGYARALVNGLLGAAKNVGVKIATTEAVEKQMPSDSSLVMSAASGFAAGFAAKTGLTQFAKTKFTNARTAFTGAIRTNVLKSQLRNGLTDADANSDGDIELGPMGNI